MNRLPKSVKDGSNINPVRCLRFLSQLFQAVDRFQWAMVDSCGRWLNEWGPPFLLVETPSAQPCSYTEGFYLVIFFRIYHRTGQMPYRAPCFLDVRYMSGILRISCRMEGRSPHRK